MTQHRMNTLFTMLAGGAVLSLPLLPLGAIAQTTINPCPRVFYEAPFNTTVVVPQGCPPNAFGQTNNSAAPAASPTVDSVTEAPTVTPPAEPTTPQAYPPLPETLQDAIATVTPTNGTVDVMLTNSTNTTLTYQVIEHTQTRILPANQTITLRDLPAPVTITIQRQDDGFVAIAPISTTEPGTLHLSLDETPTLDNSQTTVRIQENGRVFVN